MGTTERLFSLDNYLIYPEYGVGVKKKPYLSEYGNEKKVHLPIFVFCPGFSPRFADWRSTPSLQTCPQKIVFLPLPFPGI